MSRQLDGRRRERDFHAATHALHWHRAEQLAVAALQDRDLTDAERDVWRGSRTTAIAAPLAHAAVHSVRPAADRRPAGARVRPRGSGIDC